MKCPKCQYIGFDEGERCRNCGYDFSLLSTSPAELDLPIKTGSEALGPFSDFSLGDERSRGGDDVPIAPRADRGAQPTPAFPELPLFYDHTLEDDTPLVSLPAAPRAPMSVRKSATGRPAGRPVFEEPVFDLEPASPPLAAAPPERAPRLAPRADSVERPAADADTASAGARLLGAVIDLLLLGSIDLAVLYFTLRLCGLGFGDARLLPLVPFGAFIALLNGGYMAAFTAAGGQSIGKMAARTRVVTADESALSPRVPLGQAVVRAIAYGVSALPAGLGFLPALLAADRRAIHDRLAHTRVVKA